MNSSSIQHTLNRLNFFSLYPELYYAAEEEVTRVGYGNGPAYALAVQSFDEWLAKGERFRKRLNEAAKFVQQQKQAQLELFSSR